MEINMKENLKKIIKKDMEHIFFIMEINLKGNGIIMILMVME